jgi:hypothetical protein
LAFLSGDIGYSKSAEDVLVAAADEMVSETGTEDVSGGTADESGTPAKIVPVNKSREKTRMDNLMAWLRKWIIFYPVIIAKIVLKVNI